MDAANRDGHPPDPHRKWIASKGPEVERLNRHAGVKTKVAQAACFAELEGVPINRRNVRPGAKLEIVEGCHRCHLRVIINNDNQKPAFTGPASLLDGIAQPPKKTRKTGTADRIAAPFGFPFFKPHHVAQPAVEESRGVGKTFAVIVKPR